jgi:SAM-dependent methyltransferase
MIEKIKYWLFDTEDALFERWHGLDLGQIIPNTALVSDNEQSKSLATAYHAVWCRNLRETFRQAKKTGIALQNFVDIGSGKGKACFYAAKKMPAEKIIGVEFSKPLVDIAVRNNAKFGCDKIVFYHADARDYRLPDANNLVFMFNPFDRLILEEFLAKNRQHFSGYSSLIAYANDIHRDSLAKFGFQTIFRNQTRKLSLYRAG